MKNNYINILVIAAAILFFIILGFAIGWFSRTIIPRNIKDVILPGEFIPYYENLPSKKTSQVVYDYKDLDKLILQIKQVIKKHEEGQP